MKNMNVSKKLIFAFSIVFVLVAITGVVGMVGSRQLNNASDRIYHSNTVPIKAIGNVRENLMTMKSDFMEIFHVIDDPNEVRGLIEHINIQQGEAIENFKIYENAIVNWDEETAYKSGKAKWDNEYANFKGTIFNLINEGNIEEAYEYFMENETNIFDPLVNFFDESSEYNAQQALTANEKANSLFIAVRNMFIIALVVIISTGMALAVYVSGMISKPLTLLAEVMGRVSATGDLSISDKDNKLLDGYALVKDEVGRSIAGCAGFFEHIYNSAEYLKKIADGDLSISITTLSPNDTIGISMRTMLENLNGMFGEINNASSQVTSGASQISNGSQALASGSTQQAATIQELSASIEDMAQKTKKNAQRTENAAQLAAAIMKNAEKGSRQMEQMIGAVNEINQANQNISKVIKAIDDIAFQTNILALNAAVEAARAGAAGKGFAVVADEVRNLAAKSAESAKETSTLIANSTEKAELGTKIADETAASLNDIVSGIKESAKIISEIAKSSEEQNSAISQINSGISGVTQVVQQNSATAEESAAASEEMSGQASMLEGLVSKFKLR